MTATIGKKMLRFHPVLVCKQPQLWTLRTDSSNRGTKMDTDALRSHGPAREIGVHQYPSLSSLLNRHKLQIGRPNILGFWADQTIVAYLLQDMCRPADNPASGEGWREHIAW